MCKQSGIHADSNTVAEVSWHATGSPSTLQADKPFPPSVFLRLKGLHIIVITIIAK